MMFVAEIGSSDGGKGLEVRVNVIRLANQFGTDKERVIKILPENKESMPPSDWRRATEEEKKNLIRCYFREINEVEKFVKGLQEF